MREKFKLFSILAIALIVGPVCCMPGCVTGNMNMNQNTPTPSYTVPVGGTLKIATWGTLDTLDSAIKWTGWQVRRFGIVETLYSFDDKMTLQPELATRYEQVSDTEYKFYLREGVKFHDGTPFNADAVVFSFNRVLDKNNARSSEYGFIESVTKTSDHVVTIKTKYAYAPLVASLTDPVMSIISPNSRDFNNTPIGTGPFKIAGFEKGVSATVTRYDDYWGGKPNLDGAVYYYITDPMARLMKLESGEVDIAHDIPQTEVKRIRNSGDFMISNIATTRTYFLYINMYKEPYNDIKVRKALNYAINKSEICDTALEGIAGKPAISVYPSIMSWSANDKVTPYQYDPAKAKGLLAEAGFGDTDGDGFIEYGGKPFTLTLKTYTSRPQLQPSAEVIVSELRAIGINAKVEILTSSAIEADMSSHNYDIALYAYNVAPTGDPDYMLSRMFVTNSSEGRRIGYSNAQVDELIAKGRQTIDPAQRKAIYDQVQAIVLDESPVICVFYQGSIIGVSKKVGNFRDYPREIYTLTPDMYLAP